MFLFLLEAPNLLFGICCFALITKHYFDFLHKAISVLGVFFFYLVDFLLHINLRNNCISLHQSSNFVWLLSSHSRSEIILFGITVCVVSSYTTSIGTVNIFSDAGSVVLLFKMQYSVTLNNSNISSSASMLVVS